MNFRPWLSFFWKHGSQAQAIIESGTKPDGHIIVDVAAALAPVVKKYKPDWAANGMVEDFVSTLRDSLTPPAS